MFSGATLESTRSQFVCPQINLPVMPLIPANNLKERMLKLGYNPDIIKLSPPVLDNSAVVKRETKPTVVTIKPPETSAVPRNEPEFINLDEWSDFEED